MGAIRWLIGGMIGGAVGAAVWVLVGYLTSREVGWIAWGVGFLVGVGVRFAAHLGDEEENIWQGIIAATLAIGAVVFGKFLVYGAIVGWSDDSAALKNVAAQFRFDDEAIIAENASTIAEGMIAKGQQVPWPPGITLDNAKNRADFPPAIWRTAESQWKGLGTTKQQEIRRNRLAIASMLQQAAEKPRFEAFFSLFDVLWFGLAAVTAYKIGVGSYGTD